MTFEEIGLHPGLLKGIADMGFTRATPVQEQAIPHVLEGKDVIASAQTGTGKTAAFMLPILHRFLASDHRKSGSHGPRALVVAPTRELAQQSMDHLDGLSQYVSVKGTAIYGGVPFPPQLRALRANPEIISATPGRLLDHVREGNIQLLGVEILVLDEADRMLDMGFLPDIRRILSLLPPKRQNLVFSATLPPEMMKLVESICKDPVTVRIGGEKPTVPVGIRHAVYPVSHEQKQELLLRLLRDMGGKGSVLIFSRTKEGADRLAGALANAGVPATVMHGDRTQAERTRALESFRDGSYQVMVATDVAARGLDIDDITHVINYDLPEEPETYIHRIGRTGRAEAKGDAFTLMAPVEEPWILAVERTLGEKLPRVTLPDFEYKKSTVAGSYHPRPYFIPNRNAGGRGARGGPGGGGFGKRVFRRGR